MQVLGHATVSICSACGPGGELINRFHTSVCRSNRRREGFKFRAPLSPTDQSRRSRGSAFHKYPLVDESQLLNGSTNSPPGTHGREWERREFKKKKEKKNRTSPCPIMLLFLRVFTTQFSGWEIKQAWCRSSGG